MISKIFVRKVGQTRMTLSMIDCEAIYVVFLFTKVNKVVGMDETFRM